jgi:hypothetical protein
LLTDFRLEALWCGLQSGYEAEQNKGDCHGGYLIASL